MKVYVVKSVDTNFVSTIDKIFTNKQDADRYAAIQKEKYDFVNFIVAEYQVFNNMDQVNVNALAI
ncbi:MAG: hypothetical protein GX958_04960 [Desulfitobacterium sp.]|nr:hypothetical protein [Desulfitobacterium sp.]